MFTLVVSTFCLTAQEIVSVEFIQNRTRAEIQAEYLPFAANGVDLYRVLYTTNDLAGVQDTASGLLAVPDAEKRIFPTLIYQHGTVSGKEDVPSNLRGGYELGEATAALGYVTLAPDYLGLGASRGLHPYVHAASEAWVAIDMLKAVQAYLPRLDVQVNEQLFITGYSQGGHAAMALHRELARNYADEFPVTASAPMSGPYSISGAMKALFFSDEEYGQPSYVVHTILSYDAAYGLYDKLEEYFDPDFTEAIAAFRDNTIARDSLEGFLLEGLRQKHGAAVPRLLLQDSVRQAVLDDPDHPLNLAMADNDVFRWAPLAPTRLFYCTGDDQVPYLNSIIARDTMQALGAADLEARDVDTEADHGGCIFPAVLATLNFFFQYQDVQTDVQTASSPDWRVFPNPARQTLFIQGVSPGAAIELFDLQGRPCGRWLSQGEGTTIPLNGRQPGMHLLRITTNAGSWTTKVMVTP